MSNIKYAEPLGISKADAMNIALKISKMSDYLDHGDIHSSVKKLGGKISYVDFWENIDESGSLEVRSLKDFDIFIPMHTSPERDNFTIAHELGHYVLHYVVPSSRADFSDCLFKAKRYGTGRVEWEANWFSAGFLMPESLFRELFDKYDGDVRAISNELGVSYSAAEVRAKDLGLTK